MTPESARSFLKYLDTAKPARTYREAAKRRKLGDECRRVVRTPDSLPISRRLVERTLAEIEAMPF